MYVGHLGLGLVGSGVRPDVPVAAYLVASAAPDLLVHEVFHTLPGIGALAAVAAAVGARWFDVRVGVIFGLLVLSHVGADLVTGLLELWPGGPRRGLVLYDRPVADLLVEGLVIAVGWWCWRRTLRPRAVRWAPGMLVGLLACQVVFALFLADVVDA